uniref:Serine aminopeptidase S33 domain-containing protein n=1 Tax=Chenopodium quinoa TaxID=63459 RepID=A0A803MRP8_CHEQI
MSLNPVNQPQKMVVVNDQSEKLVGLLHDTGSKDVVVVCHGFKSSKEQETMVNICGALEKEGISAYRFDFSGNGESDGAFAYGNYMKEAEDLRAVVKNFNGANRIVSAILGHSKGGNVVLLYASKYHDVRTVVNLSGRYDLKKGIAERMGEDFMERIEKKGYIDVECKKNRVLTVHGSADKTTPVEDAYEFSKIIPNHKLHIIEGANHPFSEHQDELIPVTVNFIKLCMQQDKEISG